MAGPTLPKLEPQTATHGLLVKYLRWMNLAICVSLIRVLHTATSILPDSCYTDKPLPDGLTAAPLKSPQKTLCAAHHPAELRLPTTLVLPVALLVYSVSLPRLTPWDSVYVIRARLSRIYDRSARSAKSLRNRLQERLDLFIFRAKANASYGRTTGRPTSPSLRALYYPFP